MGILTKKESGSFETKKYKNVKLIDEIQRNKVPYLFILPTMILLVAFYIIPIVVAFFISFTDLNLKGLANWSKIDFIGFQNYINLFQDDLFYKALFNTLFYVMVGVPILVILALLVALLLNYGTGKIFNTFRAVYYTPSITNTVAVAVVWGYLYNSQFGMLNHLLSQIGIENIQWLNDPQIAKISVIILAIWKSVGLNMIIFLAALKSVPKSYYEAASIDGAGKLKQFFYITLPSIKFSMFFVVVTTLIGWFQFFEEPYVLTEGGPLNSTISMSLYIYQKGFSRSNFGYAAAASVILLAIIMLVTVIQFKLQKNEE